MPKARPKTKRPRSSAKAAKASSAKRPSVASKAAKAKPRKTAAAKAAEAFVRGVLLRGEAAKVSKRAALPPGATHEIVAENEKGLPKLRRRRFSLA
jgi:hypothetical protein